MRSVIFGLFLLGVFSGCGALPQDLSLSKITSEILPGSYAQCPKPDEGWCIFFDDGSQISLRVDTELRGTLESGPIHVPVEGSADEYGYTFQICGLNQYSVGTLAFPAGDNNLTTATLAIGGTSVLGTVMTPAEGFMPLLEPSVTGKWSASLDTQPVDAEIRISQHAGILFLSVSGNQGPDLLWNAHPASQNHDCPLIGGSLQEGSFSFAETDTTGSTFTGEFNSDQTGASAMRGFADGSTAQSITLQRKL